MIVQKLHVGLAMNAREFFLFDRDLDHAAGMSSRAALKGSSDVVTEDYRRICAAREVKESVIKAKRIGRVLHDSGRLEEGCLFPKVQACLEIYVIIIIRSVNVSQMMLAKKNRNESPRLRVLNKRIDMPSTDNASKCGSTRGEYGIFLFFPAEFFGKHLLIYIKLWILNAGRCGAKIREICKSNVNEACANGIDELRLLIIGPADQGSGLSIFTEIIDEKHFPIGNVVKYMLNKLNEISWRKDSAFDPWRILHKPLEGHTPANVIAHPTLSQCEVLREGIEDGSRSQKGKIRLDFLFVAFECANARLFEVRD